MASFIRAKEKSMKELFWGGCSCGAVRYTISDKPIFTQACHCSLCRRYTASAFIVHSFIETTKFNLETGQLFETDGPTGSGKGQKVSRCKVCADQVYSVFNRVRGKITSLKTTTLDQADKFPPQAQIFTKDKLSWVQLANIPAFEEYYNFNETLSAESLRRWKATGF
jgi:hypothetical protein